MSLLGMNLLSPLPGHASSPQSKRSFSALKVAGRSLILAALWTAASVQAQNYEFTTFAGVNGTPGSTNGSGSSSGKPLFNNPGGIVVDSTGTTFLSDTRNNSIRKIDKNGVVTTLAGISGVEGSVDGTGNAARFSAPQGSAIDSAGNIFVADFGSNTIRKVTPGGVVTTLAGLAYSTGATDATGSAARFNRPINLAVDKSGNVFVTDSENNSIRKITSAGVVTTLAGSLNQYYGTADSTGQKATTALFHRPHGIAVDSTTGTVYVADSANNTIRKITTAGDVTTPFGKAETGGSADGIGTNSRFSFPSGLALTAAGDILYVADEANHLIRKIVLATSTVTTIAGKVETPGFADGIETAATLNNPTGLALDAAGNLYVSDYSNHLVRKLTFNGSQWTVSTVAGVAGIAGSAEGTGYSASTASLLYGPSATAIDTDKNIYVADTNNQLIRKITNTGVATTLAGTAGIAGATDALGIAARFYNPSGIAVSPNAVYVADTAAHTIRKISRTAVPAVYDTATPTKLITDAIPAGTVTTLAGVAYAAGDQNTTIATTYTFVPPTDPTVTATSKTYSKTVTTTVTTFNPTATTATTTTSPITTTLTAPVPADTTTSLFNLPSSIVVDGNDNVYVSDYNNHTIRKITSAGVVTVLAGSGTPGSANGVGTLASFNRPRGLAIDGAGTILYVADLGNQVIRKIDIVTTTVSLFAGTVGVAGNADGAKLSATFNGPSGLTVDSNGNVVVADSSNHTIRLISPAGIVSTPAGLALNPGYADGTASYVRFNQPMGICADGTTIYVADYRNNTIRKGTATSSGSVTNPPSDTGTATTGNSKILQPAGIAPDISSGGYLFVADTANHVIKKIAKDGSVTIYAGKASTTGSADGTGTAATFNAPTGLVNDGSNNLYVADRNNALIRKISSTGVVTTLAGSSTQGNQDGLGTAATFKSPVGITIDSSGNLYVADASAHTIRKINLVAVAATTAVAATPGSAATTTGGTPVLATPAIPAMPAIPAFTVTTVAGAAMTSGETDGAGTAARFNSPRGVAVDNTTGFIYVSDTNNNTIRRIDPLTQVIRAADGFSIASTIPAYTVTTHAGSAGISGSYDGTGALALFSRPTGLFASGSTLYVADTGNSLIRSIGSGVVTTTAGIAGIAGYRDGVRTNALLNFPEALSPNSEGLLSVADTGNSSIRVLSGSSIVGISLKDPSTTTTTTTTTTTATASSSGGGAMSSWFVGVLTLLLVVSRRTRRCSV